MKTANAAEPKGRIKKLFASTDRQTPVRRKMKLRCELIALDVHPRLIVNFWPELSMIFKLRVEQNSQLGSNFTLVGTVVPMRSPTSFCTKEYCVKLNYSRISLFVIFKDIARTISEEKLRDTFGTYLWIGKDQFITFLICCCKFLLIFKLM